MDGGVIMLSNQKKIRAVKKGNYTLHPSTAITRLCGTVVRGDTFYQELCFVLNISGFQPIRPIALPIVLFIHETFAHFDLTKSRASFLRI